MKIIYKCRPVSSQGVLKQAGEFGVAVRHVRGTFAPVTQSADHIAQS